MRLSHKPVPMHLVVIVFKLDLGVGRYGAATSTGFPIRVVIRKFPSDACDENMARILVDGKGASTELRSAAYMMQTETRSGGRSSLVLVDIVRMHPLRSFSIG